MAGNGTLLISGTQTGLPSGTETYSITINFSAVSGKTLVNLLSGANTITVPAGCAGCIISPPATNAIGLTLKGVTGDTGIAISPNVPTLISFPTTAPASFVITAASLTTGNTEVCFF